MVELSDLAVFRAVVEMGGVTKAAARLNRVQSNVTARMKKLEEDLGTALFTRQGRGVQLAPAGQILLPFAERLLDLAEEAREAVRGDAFAGGLRLGTMESTAAVRLPAPLAEFHRRYPAITLELKTGASRPLAEQVLRGDLDAALVAEPVEDPRLETHPVYVEELAVVMPAGWDTLAGKSLTLLAFTPGCSYRKTLEDWVAAQGAVPDRIVEMNSYHAMLGCVVAGMGIAMVPASVIAIYPGNGNLSLVPLGGQVRTLLVWRKAAPQARIQALLEVLLSARS
jgi:DNA-binding transcriptional LysR family regulator